jgi:hypothetical protein
MSDIVPTDEVEDIVGAERHEWTHLGRAVSEQQRVYVLHSKGCIDTGIDLRDCAYSKALDEGIELGEWEDWEDQPVWLWISDGRLLPKALL